MEYYGFNLNLHNVYSTNIDLGNWHKFFGIFNLHDLHVACYVKMNAKFCAGFIGNYEKSLISHMTKEKKMNFICRTHINQVFFSL